MSHDFFFLSMFLSLFVVLIEKKLFCIIETIQNEIPSLLVTEKEEKEKIE